MVDMSDNQSRRTNLNSKYWKKQRETTPKCSSNRCRKFTDNEEKQSLRRNSRLRHEGI